MKKLLLLVSSFVLLGSFSIDVNAQTEDQPAETESTQNQGDEAELLEEIFEGKTWWEYSSIEVDGLENKEQTEYVEGFETVELSESLVKYFENIISQLDDVEEESFNQQPAQATVNELKIHDDNSNMFTHKIFDHYNNELEVDESYELSNYDEALNLYEIESISESSENNRAFLFKQNDAIYHITKGNPNDDGTEQLVYDKYIDSDSEELQPLKDSIDAVKAESESESEADASVQEVSSDVESESLAASNEFNPEDYPYITDYESVMRSSDGMVGEKINIYGTVVQVSDDSESGITMLRVATVGSYDGVYLVYMRTPETRILEDDVVDVYGTSLGIDSYEAVMGNSVTVPNVLAEEVWIEGIDF